MQPRSEIPATNRGPEVAKSLFIVLLAIELWGRELATDGLFDACSQPFSRGLGQDAPPIFQHTVRTRNSGRNTRYFEDHCLHQDQRLPFVIRREHEAICGGQIGEGIFFHTQEVNIMQALLFPIPRKLGFQGAAAENIDRDINPFLIQDFDCIHQTVLVLLGRKASQINDLEGFVCQEGLEIRIIGQFILRQCLDLISGNSIADNTETLGCIRHERAKTLKIAVTHLL